MAAGPAQRAPTDQGSTVLVIAHRGGAGLAPENTLAAFRNAVRVGADYVELDVRKTADGVLVLMHDRTVDRTTDGTGEVSALSWRRLAGLNAAAKFKTRHGVERVPTLEQAARFLRGKVGIYLDHKEASPSEVLAALDRAGFSGPLAIYGSPGTLAEYRNARPALPVMCGHPPDATAMRDLWLRLSPLVLDGHVREWTTQQAADARAIGIPLWFDVLGPDDNEQGWDRAVSLGAVALQTDYPDRLVRWLRERRLHR